VYRLADLAVILKKLAVLVYLNRPTFPFTRPQLNHPSTHHQKSAKKTTGLSISQSGNRTRVFPAPSAHC
jgi:hypothetical protein